MVSEECGRSDIAAAKNATVKNGQQKPLPGDEYSTKHHDEMTLSEISEAIYLLRRRIQNVKNRIKQKYRLLMRRIENPQYMEEMSREIIEEMLRKGAISKEAYSEVLTEKYEHEKDIVHDFERGITKTEGQWLCGYLFWQTMYRLQHRRVVVAEMVVTLKRLQRKYAELKKKEGNMEDPKSKTSEPNV